MVSLVVRIERLVDDDFPRVVQCSLIDAGGVRHDFVEKVPVVSASDIRAEGLYLSQGALIASSKMNGRAIMKRSLFE